MESYEYLRMNLENEFTRYYGAKNKRHIDHLSTSWMDDESNSAPRFHVLEKHFPGAKRVLDMASGCGTFVFYGLLHGYDAYGIEPEKWKNEFIGRKANEYGYPQDWKNRFMEATGEALPFGDDYFDAVSSYQTLEHVSDPCKCIHEMVRVTKPGGGIHIRCPDYKSTYEAHYLLPWLPLMPRKIARIYLRLLRRPHAGLDGIKYITHKRIMACLAHIENQDHCSLEIMDRDRESFREKLAMRLPGFEGMERLLYPLYRARAYLRTAFRSELNVDLLVFIRSK